MLHTSGREAAREPDFWEKCFAYVSGFIVFSWHSFQEACKEEITVGGWSLDPWRKLTDIFVQPSAQS